MMNSRSAYLSEDTICAIATEVGGAISVLRVSGIDAFRTLNLLTRSEKSSESEPRKLVRTYLYSKSGEPIDDALFVRFVNPQSYTGEDLVEYHIHGGGFIAQQVIELLIRLGVRQALPGEFSFRAVRNGKMTLFQAQAVADLISSSNEDAASIALEKMSGNQNRFLDQLASDLRRMAVLGEIGIDFSDQDVDEVSLPRLKEQLKPIRVILENLISSYSRGFRLQEGTSVAFVGLPNAGKSSFFNALLGEDRSIVSEVEGTTRDIVREKLTLKGRTKTITLRLEDTAGLRSADNIVEKIGIERTLQAAQKADILLFIVDPQAPRQAIQRQWDLLCQSSQDLQLEQKTLGILTKTDEAKLSDVESALSHGCSLGISKWVRTSAKTGQGLTEAIEALVEFCEKWTRREKGEVILTRLDHLKAVNLALEHLERALQVTELDLFASDLRQSLNSLGPLIGETLPDDILGKIFSDFCIGK